MQMLCHGELLCTVEISVGELLDRSEQSHPIIFPPKKEEDVSACPSLSMTLEQRLSDEKNIAVLCPLTTLTSRVTDALALRTDAGHRLLARYRRTQSRRDLDQSIKHFERASDLCLMDHPCRSAALFNLANVKFVSCQADGRYLDLDIPISLFQDALDLRPTDHPDRAITQLHLAIAMLSRFAKKGFQTDVDAAEELLSEVLDSCHANSHIHRAALLAIETSALHPAASIDVNGLVQESPAASMLPLLPGQLANQAERCLRRDDPHALDEVISLHYDALGYYNTMHTCRGQLLSNLSTMLITRFKRRGNAEDMDRAIALGREALTLHPVSHPDRSKTLNNLANQLSTRFDHRGNAEDLDQAIVLHREVLALRPVGHTHRSKSLNNLAVPLSTRFHHRGNPEDLDQAIALQREALTLFPIGHTLRSMSLNNLAVQLSTRFHHRGNAEDLDQAITLHREALALRPVGHTDRSMSLNNLANQLSTRFDHRGNAEDLDQAITLHREALTLRPVGHPDRSKSLNALANGLSTRFDHQCKAGDLDEAIALHKEALVVRPVGHADRSASLNTLANGFSTRFDHRGNAEDLDQAVALQREALALCPVGHTDRSMSLNNLAVRISTRFDHRGNPEDLDQAITLHREALALRPVGHTDRSSSLNNLAIQLSTRFDYRGDPEDLDEAVALQREALALCPVGHTDRSMSLGNLAVRLSIRFDHRGNAEDLDQAVALQREALALCPVGHTHRSKSLNNLANGLSTRFSHRGNAGDLDQAIALGREALTLCPVGHTNRALSLNNLAVQLSTRFVHQSNAEDLDQAIALHTESLALYPVGHPDRSMSLNNLAAQLSTRFDHQGNAEDLNESRENLCCALALLTQHDPRRLMIHRSLATVYLSFHCSGLTGTGGPDEDTDSLNTAMHHFKAAANFVPGSLLFRLRASLDWVRRADQHRHATELEAYGTSMQLMDAYMSATASVSSRHRAMQDFPRMLAVDAASCALRSGDVGRAVELLEQGRTIIWTQMTRLRTPLDTLQTRSDHAAALMKRFRDLSSLLDRPPASHAGGTPSVNGEAAATRYRRLVEDWNGVVEEIRKLRGFSRFLLPPMFADLQEVARGGPIIVLVASKSSCDAIIITHTQPPTSIQLPTDCKKLITLVLELREAIGKDASPKGNQTALIKALRKLWDDVVCPVVENLGGFARRGSRIWWCPTSLFNFLPLHAAGEYRENGKSLSQQYISSYTPSLTALMRARRRHDRSPSVLFAATGQNLPAGAPSTPDRVEPEPELVRSYDRRKVAFAAIGQNLPAGALSTLNCVEPELELVRSLLPPPPTVSFTKITSVDATKSRALCALQDNTWLHFACHGTQNFDDPFKSAFLMRDQPLLLLDITQMDLSRHEFAFLSACETAVGDFATPDEVIHLAAGLQFAGVESVVGTLWKVNDSTVQRLVEAFYKHLCRDGKMVSRRAAQALHQAIHSLARDKDMPLDQRIVFMHIGA
ncbi:CHAT domain-containing protein [Suillus occidentalis]|nr:CHAT domain-containing protein [Suillus occidentalis]